MRHANPLIALLALATAALVGCASGAASVAPAGSATASPAPTDRGAGGPSGASSTPVSAAPRASGASPGASGASPAVPFTLTSTAFRDGGAIPAASTCRGSDRSPELTWSGVPDGATSLTLVVDDPDANGWVHWIVLDMAPDAGGLPAAVPRADAQRQQGTNTFGRIGYSGPCPPSGTHHYRFTLYALGAPLGLPGHPDGDIVRRALAAADVLGTATLRGTARA